MTENETYLALKQAIADGIWQGHPIAAVGERDRGLLYTFYLRFNDGEPATEFTFYKINIPELAHRGTLSAPPEGLTAADEPKSE